MQSIGNVWVEKYVIAKEQNVARSIEMYLSRTPAAITPLGLVGNPVLKAWSNGHMLTKGPRRQFGIQEVQTPPCEIRRHNRWATA